MVKKIEDICNDLDTIPACDRETDGHLATAYTRYAYASRSNKRTECAVQNRLAVRKWPVYGTNDKKANFEGQEVKDQRSRSHDDEVRLGNLADISFSTHSFQ